MGDQTKLTHRQLVLRANAKVVIEAESGILVLHPSGIDLNRKWHIPGGIRDDISEPLWQTGVREVFEETGIDLKNVHGQPFKVGEWNAVDKGENVRILAVFYHVKLPKRPEVNLSEEHDNFAWIDKQNQQNYEANPEVYEIVTELL